MTPNARLIAELEHVAFCDYTIQKDLLDRAIAALSQPAIPKTLGDTVALIVRDVCELEYPAHPDKPMLLTVSVNELSEILMDRLSQDAAIQPQEATDKAFVGWCGLDEQGNIHLTPWPNRAAEWVNAGVKVARVYTHQGVEMKADLTEAEYEVMWADFCKMKQEYLLKKGLQ